MKKVFLILFGVWLTSAVSHAQNEKFSIGASVGAAIPTGPWGAKEYLGSNWTGWADPGLAFDLALKYKLGVGKYGLTALMRRQVNKLDANALANADDNQNFDSSYEVESGDWRIYEYLVGGFFSKSISKELFFEIKALGGIMDISRPSITFLNDSDYVYQSGANSIALAYMIGAGINYRIHTKIDLFLTADYLGSRPEFEVEETSNIGFTGNSIFSQEVNSINFNVGFAINLF